MFGNGFEVISVVPKKFKQFINKCFAIKSLNIACKIAKEKGFSKVVAGIRKDNVASQKLHEKLGFSFVEDFTSKNNNHMKRYCKKL